MSYDPSKLLVLVNGNIGVLESENAKFNCLVCKEPFCDHIYRIKQLQLEENVSPIISDFTSAADFHGQQGPWITLKSSTKIGFVPHNKISLPESVEMCMRYEYGYMICKYTSPPTSLICSTILSSSENKDAKKLFTLREMFNCKDKTVLSIVCL